MHKWSWQAHLGILGKLFLTNISVIALVASFASILNAGISTIHGKQLKYIQDTYFSSYQKFMHYLSTGTIAVRVWLPGTNSL